MTPKRQVYTWRRFAALLCAILNIITNLLTITFIDYSMFTASHEPYTEIEENKLYVSDFKTLF